MPATLADQPKRVSKHCWAASQYLAIAGSSLVPISSDNRFSVTQKKDNLLLSRHVEESLQGEHHKHDGEFMG